jgi:hypothetical protein
MHNLIDMLWGEWKTVEQQIEDGRFPIALSSSSKLSL